MSALLDRLAPVGERVAPFAAVDERPFDVVVDEVLGPSHVRIAGRRTLMLGGNGYLGLAFDPDVVRAAREALGEGTGLCGSRVANGTTAAHRALEAAFAEAFGKRSAMVFTTGHQANLCVVAGLCGPDDAVVLDAEAHASLVDGARLSGARTFLFRHDDPEDLAKKLRAAEGRPTLVAVEGLYSVGGDTGALAELSAVTRDAGATLVVDEAHAFGCYGERGLGVAEAAGVLDRVDVVVGTFSKALGGVGGFAVSAHPGFGLLRFVARAYLFTAAPSPSAVASAHAALRKIVDPASGPALRRALWERVHRLREGLLARGLEVGPEASPVIAVRLGDERRAVLAWQAALRDGVYVNLVLPPGCRRGQERLRASVSAAHDPEELDRAADVLARAVEGACRACC